VNAVLSIIAGKPGIAYFIDGVAMSLVGTAAAQAAGAYFTTGSVLAPDASLTPNQALADMAVPGSGNGQMYVPIGLMGQLGYGVWSIESVTNTAGALVRRTLAVYYREVPH